LRYRHEQLRSLTQSHFELQQGQFQRQAQELKHQAQRMVQLGQQHVDQLQLRMTHESQNRLVNHRARLNQLRLQLRALSHQSVLDRGYSITRGEDGQVIKSLQAVSPGDRLHTELASGEIESTVNTLKPRESAS